MTTSSSLLVRLHSNLNLQIHNHMYPYHSTTNWKQHINFNVPQVKHRYVTPLSDHNHKPDTHMWHAIPIPLLFGEVGDIDSYTDDFHG